MRCLPFVALVACTEPTGEAITSRVEQLAWPIYVPRKLDVLFVVDNSPAMAAHEATWRENQRAMMDVLSTIEGGLPNIHIGVVTTDLGARGHDGVEGTDAAGCTASGDRGELRTSANVQGRFIADSPIADGMRLRNFTGSLGDAFASIANVGTQGCAYVQPLEAMEHALGANVANAGFLRPDAHLLVVFATPNDDCSFAHGGFAIGSAEINAHECVTRDADLVDVAHYEAFLRSLKTDPSKIMVTGIMGPSEPYQLSDGPEGLQVAPSCTYGDASALPALRLKELLDRFPNRSTYSTICQRNWADALSVFASVGHPPIANRCFESFPFDSEPAIEGLQPVCSVTHRDAGGGEDVLPRCGSGAPPCWRIVTSPQRCTAQPSLELDVVFRDVPTDEGHSVIAQCLVDP